MLLNRVWLLRYCEDFTLVRCCPLRVSIHGHSTHSSHASQHIRYSDMLFLSEALCTSKWEAII